MAFYETTLVLRQDLSQADADKIADNLASVVANDGGKVVKKEYWGLRDLAYKINKTKKGHYIFLGLEASSPAIAELDRKLRISEDVIRSLTVRVEAVSKNPTPMISKRAANDE
jgi:small subunit ribosomal protein S6